MTSTRTSGKISFRADNAWGETKKTYELPGNRKAAKMLATRLIEEGFDVAYACKPLHHPLGHAFTNAIFYLDYARRGFPWPIVPFAINCYGRQVVSQRGGMPVFDRDIPKAELDPPAPAPWPVIRARPSTRAWAKVAAMPVPRL